MRESEIVQYLLTQLNGMLRCKAIKVHGNEFTESGDPDINCCKDGRTIRIEVKCKGEKPTPIQEYRLQEWKEAGALVRVITGIDEAKEFIYEIRD